MLTMQEARLRQGQKHIHHCPACGKEMSCYCIDQSHFPQYCSLHCYWRAEVLPTRGRGAE